jgi:hypothetical protein
LSGELLQLRTIRIDALILLTSQHNDHIMIKERSAPPGAVGIHLNECWPECSAHEKISGELL